MKNKTTSDRLKQLMKEKNLKQVDILKMVQPYCKQYDVKLEKNDLSQYISGKVEPGQKKLTVLASALNVNEVWLMGYDVPMDYTENVGDDCLNDDMGSKSISFNQLSIMTGIEIKELKHIAFGKNKIPKPSDLKKISEALNSDFSDYLMCFGYIEDPSDMDNKLYESGVRYLLPEEEKNFLCKYLADYWNDNTDKKVFTKENVFNTLFGDDKKVFSVKEVRNILSHNSKN